MAVQPPYLSLEALRKLEASLGVGLCKQDTRRDDSRPERRRSSWRLMSWRFSRHLGSLRPSPLRSEPGPLRSEPSPLRSEQCVVDWRMRLLLWWPRVRMLTYVGGTLGGLVLLAMVALWWRLS